LATCLQIALQFEEAQASATEDELAAEIAAAKVTSVASFTRQRPERNTFPEHLPCERVVIDPPAVCDCCGDSRLRKIGEDITKTLESIPRKWKVIETVREKFTCRDCEKISQAPASFHVFARGWTGPSLLAMILSEKFGQHQPLNRQAEQKRNLTMLDQPPPAGPGNWTAPLLARALGDIHEQYIWRFLRAQKIDLFGHKSWCKNNDPECVAKAVDIVGSYIAPPLNAVVLSVDEKPSIQALERAQGYLKLPNGRAMTGQSHDYKRHGTTTLFAA
jgi:transposase